jgi:hypothetical protein
VVLPFQNLTDDPELEHFADGLVEEIITALSHILCWAKFQYRRASDVHIQRARGGSLLRSTVKGNDAKRTLGLLKALASEKPSAADVDEFGAAIALPSSSGAAESGTPARRRDRR